MKLSVIGGGGREHAILWKARQSALVDQLICAPGNGGISKIAKCYPIKADDIQGQLDLAREEKPDLVVIGPEGPLVLGLADKLREMGIMVVGPSATAARIEGSKVFCKELLLKHKIPTAQYLATGSVTDADAAIDYLGVPIVVKANGLAAGKGVIICLTKEEARTTVRTMMEEKKFGDAGSRVVLEEFLTGRECSIVALVDYNQNILVFLPSRDHKRLRDGDQGPNTGGMGAYAPVPDVTPELLAQIERDILRRAVQAMTEERIPYQGFLYAGLMITDQGPKVLEFNCRPGDPETQPVLPLYKGDFVEALVATCEGNLNKIKPRWSDQSAVCVIVVSEGYGEQGPKTGQVIEIGGSLGKDRDDYIVFHAGTGLNKASQLVVTGGRVVGITSVAENLEMAALQALAAAPLVRFDGAMFRRDIGPIPKI